MLQAHDPVALAALFHALLFFVLGVAAVAQLLLLLYIIGPLSPRRTEVVMRSAAVVAGILIFLGARVMGLTTPAFLLPVILLSGAYLTWLVGFLIPGALGFALGFYVTRFLNSRDARRDAIGMRVMTMVLTLSWFVYIDTLFVASGAASAAGGADLKLLMPNLSFTLALLLFAILKYYPLPDEPPAQQSRQPAE